MVKCFYDLHIHSALSPCASSDMTLHNIVNMACLKALDMIAITDHNSAKNVENTIKIARNTDLMVIPGIEVETYEGIHLLCYFRTITDLKLFDQIVYKRIPRIQNKEDLCGEQLIFDEGDRVVGKEVKMLMNSTNMKLHEVIKMVGFFNGLIIPAHIDRKANGILSILGFIPEDLKINGVEVSSNHHGVGFNKYRKIRNSDAHYLGNICEKLNYLNLKTKSITGFFEYFGDTV